MVIYHIQQLYRDILTVTITLFYLVLVYVSIYAIELGWENIIKFLVIQIYAIKLSYLFNKSDINPRWVKMLLIEDDEEIKHN